MLLETVLYNIHNDISVTSYSLLAVRIRYKKGVRSVRSSNNLCFNVMN